MWRHWNDDLDPGNHPQMAAIFRYVQVSQFIQFSQICMHYIYIYTIRVTSDNYNMAAEIGDVS